MVRRKLVWNDLECSGTFFKTVKKCPVRSEYVLNLMKKLLLNVEAWIKNMRIRATFMSPNFKCPQLPQHYGGSIGCTLQNVHTADAV